MSNEIWKIRKCQGLGFFDVVNTLTGEKYNFDDSRTYTLGKLVCDLLNEQWEQYLKIKSAYENVYEYMEELENHYYNNESQKELINKLMDEKLELKKEVIFLQGELHKESIKSRQMALREVRDEIDKLIEMGDYH